MSAGCIESKKDAVQDHVSRQQRRPLSQQGPATVLRSPSADLAQRSQCSSSTRGTKDAISPTARRQASARTDVRICVSPSPHSSRESRWCTVVEIQYLWRASERGWPHLGSGDFRLFGGVVSRHILWLEAGRRTRTKRGDHLPRACDAGGARGRRRSTSRSIPA